MDLVMHGIHEPQARCLWGWTYVVRGSALLALPIEAAEPAPAPERRARALLGRGPERLRLPPPDTRPRANGHLRHCAAAGPVSSSGRAPDF
jgi:hypothetical protein